MSGEQLVISGLWLTPVVSLHVTYPTEHMWGQNLALGLHMICTTSSVPYLAPTQSLQYKLPSW